jgi:hypothetical protein
MSRRPTLSFTAGMGGTKRQIIKRIDHIASHKKDLVLLKVKSICIFTLTHLSSRSEKNHEISIKKPL